MTGYQLSPWRCNEIELHRLATKKFVHYSLLTDVAKLLRTVVSLAKSSDDPCLQLQYNAKLRDAADALSTAVDETYETQVAAITWLEDICTSQSCSAICRAWSYYLLGSMTLKSTRKHGDGCRKWKRSLATKSASCPSADTRNYFTHGLQLLGTSCDLLTRNIQRCLAVTISTGNMNDSEALECFSLINDSVGASIKSKLRSWSQNKAEDEQEDSSKDNPSAYYRKTSTLFLKELGKVVPAEWRFITAALSPTGELLLSSLEFAEPDEPSLINACIGPDAFATSDTSNTADIYDNIVKPLHDVVARSQQQLASEGIVDDGNETSKEEATRQWWQMRKQVDSDLQLHLNNVERALLSSDTAQRVLLGRPLNMLNESADGNDELP